MVLPGPVTTRAAMIGQSYKSSALLWFSSGIGALDSLGFMSRSAKRREQVWENLHVSPRTAPLGSGLWCDSDLLPIISPLSRAVLPGQPSRAFFAGAPFAMHRLWAMSSIVCLIALISVTSGPNFLACSKMLRVACVCSCGTSTRSLSALVSLPCCRRLRHDHNPVLISQAG